VPKLDANAAATGANGETGTDEVRFVFDVLSVCSSYFPLYGLFTCKSGLSILPACLRPVFLVFSAPLPYQLRI
jgi:hypothetical protein